MAETRLELPATEPAHGQLGAVAEHQARAPPPWRADFGDRVERDDRRAMDPEEPGRIEPALQLSHRDPRREPAALVAGSGVVAARFERQNRLDRERDRTSPHPDDEPIERRSLDGPTLSPRHRQPHVRPVPGLIALERLGLGTL